MGQRLQVYPFFRKKKCDASVHWVRSGVSEIISKCFVEKGFNGNARRFALYYIVLPVTMFRMVETCGLLMYTRTEVTLLRKWVIHGMFHVFHATPYWSCDFSSKQYETT
jgi:hypothetical protein